MTRTTLLCCLILLGLTTYLHTPVRSQNPGMVLQVGHSNVVRSVVFSPDGNMLASGGDDKTVAVWDMITGRQVRSLKGHADGILSVAFSPNSKILASGSADLTAKLWDVTTGEELYSLRHAGPVFSLCFSPDGEILASSDESTIVKLWTVSTGKLLRTLDGHGSYLSAITFSPDGKLLASGSLDDSVKVWDAATGEQLLTLRGHTDTVVSLAFSPDGKLLASGSDDRTVKIWNMSTGKELRSFPDHAPLVNCLAFNSDGSLLASGSTDETVKLWEVSTGKLSYSVNQTSVSSVAFSPDGKVLATAGFGKDGKTVNLWDVANHGQHRSLGGGGSFAVSVAFSNDGKMLAVGNASGRVKIWDLITGRQAGSLSGNGYIHCIAFSPDGKLLAVGDDDLTVKLWDVATFNSLGSFPAYSAYADYAGAIAFSRDGKMLASRTGTGALKLWDVSTGRTLHLYGEQSERAAISVNNDRQRTDLVSVAFSPDGKMLASGSGNENAKLWDVSTGQQVRLLEVYADTIAFSPDGRLLATGGVEDNIRLWDAATGQQLHSLDGHSGVVVFSPDGHLLGSINGDNTITLWDVATRQQLHQLTGHAAYINSIAFSPNGKVLASASDDDTVKLWDVSEGKELASLIALDDSFLPLFQAGNWLVVTPDGLFDGTADAMREVSWRVGNTNDVVPLESFFNDFYHPGLLEELLGGDRPKAAVDIATAFQMPGLRLMLSQRLAHFAERNGKILLCFNEKPTAAPQLFSDAQPLYFTVDSLICDGTDTSCTCHKELPSGTQLELVNASNPLSFEMAKPSYDGAKSETSDSTLHVQTIGVGNYDKGISGFKQLPSSVAGAKEIENFFLQEKGDPAKPFRDVKVWPGIYDTDATTLKIRQRLAEMAKVVRENDVVFLFLSGHGIVPAGQEMFYFASSDMRGPLPEDERGTGLNTAMLAEAIREMPAMRVVLIIDACQSGGAMESLGKIVEVKLRVAQRYNQMEKPDQSKQGHEVGIYLIAVATPLQEAVQPKIGYGALVTTLMEALRSDQQPRGSVWMRDLVKYIQLRLPAVSAQIGQRHTPMIVPSGVDFVLAPSQTGRAGRQRP